MTRSLEICLDKRTGDKHFDEIIVGSFTRISFHRTLRIPEDGRDYPLPAGLGRFPIHRVEDYADRVPEQWLQEGGFFIPLYQKEALFLEFEGPRWHPSIAKVCVGRVNAITGDIYSENISRQNQDYLVIPDQRWLDGINSGNGVVRQFVAMPLGDGYTIEAQMTDEEVYGGFQLTVHNAVNGAFPERNPALDILVKKITKARRLALDDAHFLTHDEKDLYFAVFGKKIRQQMFELEGNDGYSQIRFQPGVAAAQIVMGVAAGGKIKQRIISDPYGVEYWDTQECRTVTIHMVNSLLYKQITGNNPPLSPITKDQYILMGFPWFKHYEEDFSNVRETRIFRRILGVSEIERRRGMIESVLHTGINIPTELIRKIHTPDTREIAEASRSRAYASSAKSEWQRALSEITRAIDLSQKKSASDYALRCYCNYNLGNYSDGESDGSLGLEINSDSKDARSWRACCRLAVGDHEGLKEDADVLASKPETAIFGLEMQAEAAMLSGRFQDAIDDALKLRKIDINHARAEEILTVALSKVSNK